MRALRSSLTRPRLSICIWRCETEADGAAGEGRDVGEFGSPDGWVEEPARALEAVPVDLREVGTLRLMFSRASRLSARKSGWRKVQLCMGGRQALLDQMTSGRGERG